jgi:hypothetical protein
VKLVFLERLTEVPCIDGVLVVHGAGEVSLAMLVLSGQSVVIGLLMMQAAPNFPPKRSSAASVMRVINVSLLSSFAFDITSRRAANSHDSTSHFLPACCKSPPSPEALKDAPTQPTVSSMTHTLNVKFWGVDAVLLHYTLIRVSFEM